MYALKVAVIAFIGSSSVEFTHCRPPQRPAPEFINAAAAEVIVKDIAALVGIFEGPLVLEAHVKPAKGGNAAFWEDVADAQAALLRAELLKVGVPGEHLTVRGLAGTKGQNLNLVLLRLNRDLFLEHPVEFDAKLDESLPRRQGRSPQRR
mmetsp:Transcript_50334/g.116846  ORF Transcript_50334/g.116846 Transcript_50334/m.116846 type:complete len:150 (+) Transcript_50334:188-637(+)